MEVGMRQLWRRCLRGALLYETVCAAAILIFGFGPPFDPGPSPWYFEILPATQLPGILLLTRLGLCCGFASHLVISDAIMDRWGGLTPIGVPILFVANTLAVTLIVFLGAALWSRRRSGPPIQSIPPAV
jgi:hypothetical protein